VLRPGRRADADFDAEGDDVAVGAEGERAARALALDGRVLLEDEVGCRADVADDDIRSCRAERDALTSGSRIDLEEWLCGRRGRDGPCVGGVVRHGRRRVHAEVEDAADALTEDGEHVGGGRADGEGGSSCGERIRVYGKEGPWRRRADADLAARIDCHTCLSRSVKRKPRCSTCTAIQLNAVSC
jgi:hypothetical protein